MKDVLAILCMVLGTVLILAQVRLAFFPKTTVQKTDPALTTSSIGEKIIETTGKFAEKAPLMGGGILLLILAAILSGDISIAASADSK